MRIVVTGFEPFDGREKNASWEAVRALQGVERTLLPVSFARAAERVRAIAASRPDAVICVGEAGGRKAVSVERTAINLMDARIPDCDGAQPRDAAIIEGGPAAYFSTLPTRRILDAVSGAGIPAEMSYTAGTYVCNCVFYALMESARAHQVKAAGFIHVPAWDADADRLRQALAIAVRCTEQWLTETR